MVGIPLVTCLLHQGLEGWEHGNGLVVRASYQSRSTEHTGNLGVTYFAWSKFYGGFPGVSTPAGTGTRQLPRQQRTSAAAKFPDVEVASAHHHFECTGGSCVRRR